MNDYDTSEFWEFEEDFKEMRSNGFLKKVPTVAQKKKISDALLELERAGKGGDTEAIIISQYPELIEDAYYKYPQRFNEAQCIMQETWGSYAEGGVRELLRPIAQKRAYAERRSKEAHHV